MVASALMLRMNIMTLQLCCAHKIMLMLMLKNGFQTDSKVSTLNLTLGVQRAQKANLLPVQYKTASFDLVVTLQIN